MQISGNDHHFSYSDNVVYDVPASTYFYHHLFVRRGPEDLVILLEGPDAGMAYFRSARYREGAQPSTMTIKQFELLYNLYRGSKE
jgi:hypothetical protein